MSIRAGFTKGRRKRGAQDFELQITSLIDTLVIILAFMLMTVGSGSVNLEMAQGLTLPWSSQGADLSQGLKIIARLDGVLIEQEQVVPLSNGEAQRAVTSEDGRKITPLFQKMAERARESKKQAEKSGVKFEGKVLLQADKGLPLKTVKQIMYTAARAGYNDFKFAVVRQ